MLPNPAPLALLELFSGADGKEYSLQWYLGPEKGRSGQIKMTDLLFNWCFYPTAFGLDGAYREKKVASSSSISVQRRIGGPTKTYSRSGYTVRLRPTGSSNPYDGGTQLYVEAEGKMWNFEISGKLTEFRLWLDQLAKTNNLRRTLVIHTAHGVPSSHTPTVSVAP